MADLDSVVEAVLQSSKYRTIAPEFVRKIAAEELRKFPKAKEAIKATKNKLHQVAGAYLTSPPNYDSWLERLETANDPDERREVCRALMQTHASTRERLPILDEFYRVALAEIAPLHSVLDLACGLNPLAIPFMPLADGATYYACDLYTDQAEFFNRAFPLLGVSGEAWAADVTQTVPSQKVDLALIIKAIPCLQQIDKGIGVRLLEGVQADHILVSYPAQSLGGKGKGMRANYEAQFNELVTGKGWTIRKYDFATELAFLITK
ncbi:MAG: 16S rRNA methyltransferase [Chloroflexota bacterium]